MTHYGEIASAKTTPQNERARADQVENNAGGFVFEVGPWKQLDRFLILGQIGPTYYASERKVVRDNVDVIRKCLAEDGPRVVDRLVEISDAGRAPKNDPAIFVLALAASSDDPKTRAAALAALPKVCRIGTHLFHFMADVNELRGWGPGLRKAVAKWYVERHEQDLAMQAIKYQSRDKWAHRDVLRLAHPKADTPVRDAIFRWMVGGTEAFAKPRKHGPTMSLERLPSIIAAHETAKVATSAKEIARLIDRHKLPRECVPTQWLNDPLVWEALLPHMGITAMIRNLGKMTSIGLLKPLSSATNHVVTTLTSKTTIKNGRVHPMAFLLAQGIYRQGRGDKGSLVWQPVQSVADALDEGFYLAFDAVEPTGKNTFIALDVSASMTCGYIAGTYVTPRVASAAMAMVTARTEKNWHMAGFTSSGNGYGGQWGGGETGLTTIDVSRTERLDALCSKVDKMRMGGTDCALPMIWAEKNKIEVDVFQVYTDNETWAGNVQPFQALRSYRQKMGRDAKLVVVGLTATAFTIADPSDAGMLDVVGMDSSAPAIMSAFAKGEV